MFEFLILLPCSEQNYTYCKNKIIGQIYSVVNCQNYSILYKLSVCSACSVLCFSILREKESIQEQKSKIIQETYLARIQVGWT